MTEIYTSQVKSYLSSSSERLEAKMISFFDFVYVVVDDMIRATSTVEIVS